MAKRPFLASWRDDKLILVVDPAICSSNVRGYVEMKIDSKQAALHLVQQLVGMIMVMPDDPTNE